MESFPQNSLAGVFNGFTPMGQHWRLQWRRTQVNTDCVISPHLLNKLTLEGKAGLCSGKNFWFTKDIDRLGIPSFTMTDGPHGLRKQDGDGETLNLNESVPATCFPSGAGLASGWNRSLLKEVGSALGKEARREDVKILLGPAVNIKRSPLYGRNFEYFSEDPYLTGQIAKNHILGLQEENVGAFIKHFAVNNQESRRMLIDARVDERTLWPKR